MWITVGNLNSKLTQATDEERNWLNDYLSFSSTQFRKGAPPITRVERMFSIVSQTFPSGFVSMVQRAAQSQEKTGTKLGFRVDLIDSRKIPCVPGVDADLAWLRDYQLDAAHQVAKDTRGIISAPTGSGKGEIVVGLAVHLPCRWGFFVHRMQLVDDIADRYERRTGLIAGRIGEGAWDAPDEAQLVCMSFKSVYEALQRGDQRAIDLVKSFDGIMVDECHTLPAGTFYATVQAASNAYYRVGLSGTPLARGDKRSILAIAALGPVIYRIPAQLLIARGVLAKPKIRFVTVVQMTQRPTWQGVYGELVVRSAKRNAVVVDICRQATQPGLVFVKEEKHGHELSSLIRRAGFKCEFVWGNHSTESRKRYLDRLMKGHFDFIVCSSIFQEGIDSPGLRSVINAAGGKSTIATLQRAGRGMRVDRDVDGNVKDGGDEFESWDIHDRGNTMLERHAKARVKSYQAEGHEVLIQQPSAIGK